MNVNQPQHYGLLENDLHQIIDAAETLPEIEQLILFGSRAKGNYKPGSDVDLAIKGSATTYETVLHLADLLNEQKPLPYYFDIVNYHSIYEPELIKHIDQVGIVILDRENKRNQHKH